MLDFYYNSTIMGDPSLLKKVRDLGNVYTPDLGSKLNRTVIHKSKKMYLQLNIDVNLCEIVIPSTFNLDVLKGDFLNEILGFLLNSLRSFSVDTVNEMGFKLIIYVPHDSPAATDQWWSTTSFVNYSWTKKENCVKTFLLKDDLKTPHTRFTLRIFLSLDRMLIKKPSRVSFQGNTFDSTFGNNGNIFGNTNNSNGLGSGITFGNASNGNTFGNVNNSNGLGSGNTFGNANNGNTFGNANNGNTFGNASNSNAFGNASNSNTFGNANSFGNGNASNSNTFGNANSFGNGNNSSGLSNGNIFGNTNNSNVPFSGNTFGTTNNSSGFNNGNGNGNGNISSGSGFGGITFGEWGNAKW